MKNVIKLKKVKINYFKKLEKIIKKFYNLYVNN